MSEKLKKLVFFIFVLILLSSAFSQPRPALTTPANFTQLISSVNSFISQGKYSSAIKILEQSASLAKSAEEKNAYYLNLANARVSLGQMNEAAEDYQKCLYYARGLNDNSRISYCETSLKIIDLYNQSKSYRQTGNHEQAIKLLTEAINLCDSINNVHLKLKCLRRISYSYLEDKNPRPEAFLKYNIEANKLAQNLKLSYEVILTFMNIGHYYYSNNNLNLAINYFSQALPFINEDTIPQDVFDIYYNLGVVYSDIGNFERSLDYFSQALSIISSDQSNPYFPATLNNLGFSYAKKGLVSGQKEDFDHALEYFQKALEANEKSGNRDFQVVILNNIGSVKAHLGENLEALYYLNKARSLAEKQNLKNRLTSIYTNIGIIYTRLGDYQNSTLYYDKAINLALTEKENRTLWESYLEKGNLLKKQGDLQSARFYYLNSINIIESLRSSLTSEEDKVNFLGTDKRLDAYHNLIDLLIKESQATKNTQLLEEAFSYLERARARVFLEQIEAAKLAESQPANIKLVNQEKELMSDISGLFTRLLSPGLSEEERTSILKEIKELENRLENIKRQIRSQNPAYAKLIYPEIISFSQAQKEFLDSRTAIFSFMVGREVSYALVLTRKGIKAFPLPSQEELRKKVIAYRRAISDLDNKDFQLGFELYQLLLKPALPENISRLIIVPDNVLNLLPFETLKPSNQPGDWLINHFNINYAPSLSSLRELVHFQNRQGRGKPSRTLFAVGDPYYGELENTATQISSRDIFQDFYGSSEIRFSRLKYSAEEISRISRLFPHSTVLERDRASEDLVKSARLTDYRVIHLAAHGLIDDQKPARSAIILALDNDPSEDGFLQMREILNLKLNADLVVLSACQTGLGRLVRGEGLEGLSRAFFFAGASSVLTSLWAINDQVSSQFMERFYLYLKSANSVSEALRKAKLEMINSSVVSHPYYWAPFLLHGNGQIKITRPLGTDRLLLIALTMAGLVIGALLIFKRKHIINHQRKNEL